MNNALGTKLTCQLLFEFLHLPMEISRGLKKFNIISISKLITPTPAPIGFHNQLQVDTQLVYNCYVPQLVRNIYTGAIFYHGVHIYSEIL